MLLRPTQSADQDGSLHRKIQAHPERELRGVHEGVGGGSDDQEAGQQVLAHRHHHRVWRRVHLQTRELGQDLRVQV